MLLEIFQKINNKISHLLMILLINIISILISIVYENINFVELTLLFFGPPVLYILFLKVLRRQRKSNKNLRNIFEFTLFIGLIGGYIIGIFAEASLAWYTSNSFFSWRLFDLIPLDGLIWPILQVLYILLIYDFFIENKNTDKIARNNLIRKYFYILITAVFFITNIFAVYYKNLLSIPYFFGFLGFSMLLLFSLISFIFKKKLNIYFICIYFFFFSLAQEIIALSKDLWSFPGNQYLANVSLLGQSFPIEELFVWMIIFAPLIILLYEFLYSSDK